MVEGEKKRDNGTHKDANRSQSGARAGRHSPLSSLAARGQDGGGGGVALDEGSTRCECQVGISSTSLLASATRVSHGT